MRKTLLPIVALIAVTAAPVAAVGQDARALRAQKLQAELFIAIRDHDIAATRSALSRHADPNARNWLNFTSLMWAANRGSLPIVQMLIRKGADVNAASMYGSALTFAENGRHEEVALYLLKRGASVEPGRLDGATPLMLAAGNGHVSLIRQLLARGANVNRRDADGATALIYAARLGRVSAAKVLLAARADVNATDSHRRSALMYAAANGEADTASQLVSAHADVNARDKRQDTPLLLAARYGNDPGTVSVLLHARADKSARDGSGQTALAIARSRGFVQVADVLRAAGAPAPAEMTGEEAVPPRMAVERSLAAIQSSMKVFASRSQCVSCHQQGLAMMTLGIAQKKGFEIDRALFGSYMQRIGDDGKANGASIHAALQNAELTKMVPPVQIGDFAIGAGYIFGGLIANHVPANPGLAEGALFVGRLQMPDGHWTYGFEREPMQSSDVTTTAMVVRLLKAYGPSEGPAGKEIARRCRLAQQWLASAPTPRAEAKAMKLLGLVWGGAPSERIAEAASVVAASQNPDGGWAGAPNGRSDAYATGMSSYALIAAGRPGDDAVLRRASMYLRKTQDADGSWYLQKRAAPANSHFDGGFPHGESQYASFAATCWAAIALAELSNASETARR